MPRSSALRRRCAARLTRAPARSAACPRELQHRYDGAVLIDAQTVAVQCPINGAKRLVCRSLLPFQPPRRIRSIAMTGFPQGIHTGAAPMPPVGEHRPRHQRRDHSTQGPVAAITCDQPTPQHGQHGDPRQPERIARHRREDDRQPGNWQNKPERNVEAADDRRPRRANRQIVP